MCKCLTPLHSTLSQLAAAACAAENFTATFDIDKYYRRTDSYNFARKGIPAVFFFSGVHDDYHKPTDTFEKVDLEKSAGVARIAYRLGWNVAMEPEAPRHISRPNKDVTEAEGKMQRAFF